MSPSTTTMRGILGLAATLPLVNALGCYSGGLAFEDLHGGVDSNDLDMDAEVTADINTVCNLVKDAVFKNGDPPFTHCSNWTVTVEPDDSCYDTCLASGLIDCDPDCGGPVVGSVNRIDWQIDFNDESDEKTLTWDMCNDAFTTELGGCSTGSEQNHDGFWYKIDPNAGACTPTETVSEPVPTTSSASPSSAVPTTSAAPTPEAKPSPYPDSPITNEFLYRGYDESSDDDKAKRTKIHDAFSAWPEILQEAWTSLEDTSDTTFDRWFPDKAGENDGRQYVKDVFAQIFKADATSPAPQPLMLTLINENEDYSKTNPCSKSTANAYFSRGQGRFHICDRGLSLPIKPTDVQCKNLGDAISTKMQTLTGTMVHEFMHWNKVGDDAPNSLGHITDVASPGPKGSLDLRKGSDSQKTFTNADSYKWFVLNAHYEAVCNQSFGDPVAAEDGSDLVEDGIDIDE